MRTTDCPVMLRLPVRGGNLKRQKVECRMKNEESAFAKASVFALLRRDKLADRLRLKNFRVVHITSVLEVSL